MNISKTASEAFSAARKDALDAGLSVLQSENGIIYEVFPDGRKIEVKRIEPPIAVKIGTVYNLD